MTVHSVQTARSPTSGSPTQARVPNDDSLKLLLRASRVTGVPCAPFAQSLFWRSTSTRQSKNGRLGFVCATTLPEKVLSRRVTNALCLNRVVLNTTGGVDPLLSMKRELKEGQHVQLRAARKGAA
jgi:hypothetical protein